MTDAPITIATFYRFAPLPDYTHLRQPLLDAMRARQVRGTILLSPEGVNATISGSKEAVDAIISQLEATPGLAALTPVFSSAHTQPFKRTKVRLKREAIRLNMTLDADATVGEHVEPEAWNALIASPDVLLLDVRNGYEVELGQFQGALNPETRHFTHTIDFVREHLDPQRHRAVAMYCTGGVRCEKFSAHMLREGFENVYQLKGGILNYLQRIPQEKSLWQGACFVFDERESVGHGLVPTSNQNTGSL